MLKYDLEFLENMTNYALDYKMGVHDIKRFIETEIYLIISKKYLEIQSDELLKLTLKFDDGNLNLTVEN